MTRVSLLTRLTFIPLALLAGVNITLVIGFWGGLGGGDALPFQIFGGALAAIEVTCMVVASDAQARGEIAKARVWRIVFVAILATNIVADFGAITAKLNGDAAARAQIVARYDAAVRTEREADAEVARLTAALDAQGLNLPAEALAARGRGIDQRFARYEQLGRLPPRSLIDQRAALEAAQIVARDLAEQRRVRDAARTVVQQAGARPEAASPQVDSIVTILGFFGATVAPETVRVVIAAMLAVVSKLVLVFGFWAISPRVAPSTPAAPVSSQASSLNAPANAAPDNWEEDGADWSPEPAVPPAVVRMPQGAPSAATDVRRSPRRGARPQSADQAFDAALDDLENGRA